jgi:hypothetical protein
MDQTGSQIVDALAALRHAGSGGDELEFALEPFLAVAAAIARREPGFDREAMIAAATPHMANIRPALTAYGDRLERLLMSTFYDQEWIAACERRTRLEAVCTLWAEHLVGLEPLSVDRESLDELLRDKGEHEGGLRPEQIPPGTPTSHWWWWYPASPPA